MGGCRCSYKSCRSATKTTENLHFFHYPVKHRDRCAIWIRNADKPQFADLPDYQLRNKVICGLHFEDKYFANMEKRRLVHNAIPSLDAGCDSTSDDLAYIEEVEILPTGSDGNTFTMQIEDIQPGPSIKKQKLTTINNGKLYAVKQLTKQSEVYTIDPSYFNQSFYNNSNIKEVIINSAPAIKAEKDEEEDCMMMYDNQESNNSDALSIEKQDEPDVDYVVNAEEDSKLQTLFFNQEDTAARTVQIEDSKGNIMVADLGENTNASSMSHYSVESNDHGSSNGSHSSPMPTSTSNPVKHMKRLQNPPPVAAEIAKIKQSISTTAIRLTNKNLVRCLKGRLPESLLGAISLHLNKRRNAITLEEQEYASVMSSLPMTGRAILRNYGWIMPTNNS